MYVRNVRQQTDDFLWTYDAELIGLFDGVYGIAASVRQSDDLCLGCLSLKQEGGKVGGILRMPDAAQYFTALRVDNRRRVPLQRMSKRIIRSDEEPGISTLLDDGLSGRLRQSIGIIGPVHADRRAGFAGQVRGTRRRDQEHSILLFRYLLNGKGDRGNWHIDNGIDPLSIDPVASDVRANVRLVLMIR